MSGAATQTILITGATGSIGMKLRHHLTVVGGFGLRLLCINPIGDPAVVTADLAEYDEGWAQHFSGADTVIHLAGASSTRSDWETVRRLNIDLTLNVYRAAAAHGVKRIVFASSNWVVAGHRFTDLRLTTQMPAAPVNPYGASKLFLERAGLDLSVRTGISFIALRIGYSQHAPGNLPGPHMEHGVWGQQMWLSDRDLCQGLERAAVVPDVRSAVLNLMSDNPGMRWDIDETRRVIGFAPQDRHVAVSTAEGDEKDAARRVARQTVEQLDWLTGKW